MIDFSHSELDSKTGYCEMCIVKSRAKQERLNHLKSRNCLCNARVLQICLLCNKLGARTDYESHVMSKEHISKHPLIEGI